MSAKSVHTFYAHAHGQLRHKFFGTYSAFIGLQFVSADAAAAALPKLGTGWKRLLQHSAALVWSGDRDALQACKVVLGSFGADVKKIDSLAKSVDYGEPFTVQVPVVEST